jgi:hypothetical protein
LGDQPANGSTPLVSHRKLWTDPLVVQLLASIVCLSQRGPRGKTQSQSVCEETLMMNGFIINACMLNPCKLKTQCKSSARRSGDNKTPEPPQRVLM